MDGLHIKQGDQGASNLHISGYAGLTESEDSYDRTRQTNATGM